MHNTHSHASQPVTTIAVDTNGADLGVAEVCRGALDAVQQSPRPIKVILFGSEKELQAAIDESAVNDEIKARILLRDAPLSIAKIPDPTIAVRNHPDASIVQTLMAVANGEADAFVAAGSTGSALVAGVRYVKRARGIYRPAIALPVPTPTKTFIMVDVGANTQARPEHLVQFAYMGRALAQSVLAMENPTVALLANGTERSKGTEATQHAYTTLTDHSTDQPGMNFVGYIEGNTLTNGAIDVVVTDGFTGNIALKTMQGVSQTIFQAMRQLAYGSARTKMGGLLLQPAIQELKADLDPEHVGGAYLLGLRSMGIIPHGHFSYRGFSQAIQRAAQAVQSRLIENVHLHLQEAQALRNQ